MESSFVVFDGLFLLQVTGMAGVDDGKDSGV